MTEIGLHTTYADYVQGIPGRARVVRQVAGLGRVLDGTPSSLPSAPEVAGGARRCRHERHGSSVLSAAREGQPAAEAGGHAAPQRIPALRAL